MELLMRAGAPVLKRTMPRQQRPPSGLGHQAPLQPKVPRNHPAAQTANIAAKVLGANLQGQKLDRAALAVHLGFGAATGVAYATASERWRTVSAARGLPFGALLWLSATQIALPLASMSKSPADSPISVQLFGLATHLVHGAVVSSTCAALL